LNFSSNLAVIQSVGETRNVRRTQ